MKKQKMIVYLDKYIDRQEMRFIDNIGIAIKKWLFTDGQKYLRKMKRQNWQSDAGDFSTSGEMRLVFKIAKCPHLTVNFYFDCFRIAFTEDGYIWAVRIHPYFHYDTKMGLFYDGISTSADEVNFLFKSFDAKKEIKEYKIEGTIDVYKKEDILDDIDEKNCSENKDLEKVNE